MRGQIASLTLAIALLVAAGCSGPGTTGGMDTSSGGGLVAAPSSGADGTEPADESGNEALPAEEEDQTIIPSTSGIRCTFDKSVDAEVEKDVSIPLSASGGSGDFLFTAENLAEGLSLAAGSTEISGTPTKAGDFKAGITVKDIQTERTEQCTLKIRVSEQITLTAAPVLGKGMILGIGSIAALWKVQVNGTADNSVYHWGFSATKNLCGSATDPRAGRIGCSAPPSTGKTAYLWMNPQPTINLPLTVTVTGDNATAPATASLTFPAAQAQLALIEEGDDSTPAEELSSPKQAVLFSVRTITAPIDDAGTDCRIQIRFCKDKAFNSCLTPTTLDNPIDNFEKGGMDLFAPLGAPSGMTSEYQYFKLSMLDERCGNDHDWLLQTLDLLVIYADQSYYRYFNPCVDKWVVSGESLKFGKKDTAVCTIVSTSDVDDAGTDDTVWLNLHLIDNAVSSFWSAALGMHFYNTGAEPHFYGTYKTSGTAARTYGHLRLGFSDYDDFERSDVTSYGDYIFNLDPFPEDTVNVFLQKDADGKRGGWHLEEYEVFIFNPGIDGGGHFRHGLCEEDRWLQDIGDAAEGEEDGLITDKCLIKSSSSGSDLITDDIGSHY